MTAPRVSVITIFKDGEAFLDEAIASVMTQTLTNFEYWLVDDGSGEAATAIAKSWAARHPDKIFYLEHEGHANLGMSAARNLGLAHARGAYVAFIDADDVWRPQKLEQQVALMDAHPTLGMVCGVVRYWRSWEGGQDVMTQTGHVLNEIVEPPQATLRLYPLNWASAPCPSDMLLRRDAVASIGGFENAFRGMYEDQAFLAKLYLAWPVWFSDQVWIDYRLHDDSCMAQSTREGRYDEVRTFFLNWFEGYVKGLPGNHLAVRVALDKALWPHRTSIGDRIARKVRAMLA